METLTNNILILPPQFDLKMSHRFILEIPGLDSFLVKSVKLPSYNKVVHDNRLIVVVHDSISPSSSQQLNEIVQNNTPLTGSIKWLDDAGTIVSECKVENLVVENVDYSLLSYELSEPSTMIVQFSFSNFTLIF